MAHRRDKGHLLLLRPSDNLRRGVEVLLRHPARAQLRERRTGKISGSVHQRQLVYDAEQVLEPGVARLGRADDQDLQPGRVER
jgi:hypothetical protein